MNKITFSSSVSKEFMEERVGDFVEFDGEGVYRVWVSSRGEIEEVVKVSNDNSFELRTREEIAGQIAEDNGLTEQEVLDDMGDFIGSDRDDLAIDGAEAYFEQWGEEDEFVFYWVK